ncbi:hypothetical protein ABR738_07185 [Streptomyces sp. Edi4]|uniref:hypothetical protein n=1 Tax=Streptomyces sp. Edi4 TaxID=3162527 RepID=UPI0033066024
MSTQDHGDATALADVVQQGLAGQAPGSPLTLAPVTGPSALEPLRRLVALEYQAHPVELAAYGNLLARSPHGQAAELWLTLGRVVHNATPKLYRVGQALGMDEAGLTRPVNSGSYAFHSALSWIATSASQAAAALAAHTDMQVYYSGACAVARRLRESDLPQTRAFIDYYDDAGDDALKELALAVVQDGLDRGADPDEVLFHAHRISDALLDVWKTAAAPPA